MSYVSKPGTRKKFLLYIMLLISMMSGQGLYSQSATVSIAIAHVSYGSSPTVTFTVSATEGKKPLWIVIDYQRVQGSRYVGDWLRATIPALPTNWSAGTPSLQPTDTRGFWLQGPEGAFTSTVTVPVTVDVNGYSPQFGACVNAAPIADCEGNCTLETFQPDSYAPVGYEWHNVADTRTGGNAQSYTVTKQSDVSYLTSHMKYGTRCYTSWPGNGYSANGVSEAFTAGACVAVSDVYRYNPEGMLQLDFCNTYDALHPLDSCAGHSGTGICPAGWYVSWDYTLEANMNDNCSGCILKLPDGSNPRYEYTSDHHVFRYLLNGQFYTEKCAHWGGTRAFDGFLTLRCVRDVCPDMAIASAPATAAQTVTPGSAIADIKYTTTNASTVTVTGLPAGVTGVWDNGSFTVSGTPTVSGAFTYTVTAANAKSCNTTATGKITVLSYVPYSGCNPATFSLSTVAFANAATYTRNGIILSAPVTASGCNKTTYAGGSSGAYNADCRTNPGYDGNLLSWCMVKQYESQLCQSPWRVPTTQDFMMYANGSTSNNSPQSSVKAGMHGWLLGGYCGSSGTLSDQGSYGDYWSSSENSSDRGYNADITSSTFLPQNIYRKSTGFTLRCVQ
ncbi:MAG: Ig domain-containing protein [Prevotellaceae bacterium]|nr:Ig domain-containing protein [Prevotellaceae bacterium]